MKKDFRIRKRRDFLKVSRFGCFCRTDFFILQAAQSNCENYRVGFTATKKIGNAVVRNRCKRRMRAAADIVFAQSGVNETDYVIIAKAKTSSVTWNVFLEELRKALIVVNHKVKKCKISS